MTLTHEQLALIGNDVIVAGPNAVWHGRAIAIAEEPSIIIEPMFGPRLTLPLAWAHPAFHGEDLNEKDLRPLDEYEPMERLAEATRRLSIHLQGWRVCDYGPLCEQTQARNDAYLAYTHTPHPSTLHDSPGESDG